MFHPVIPAPGLAGWRFLQRTYDTQLDIFSRAPQTERDTTYFREKISSITNAEELVSDRRLLGVALGAFGLQDDINNRYFIRKVLEEGTASDDALANRLSDSRYRELAEAFGFGPAQVPHTGQPGFAESLIFRFEASGFEVASGTQNAAMRVALYAQRVLPELAADGVSNDARWYTILGDPPLRQVFEKAFNLPASIGQIDIDQQLSVFKERAKDVFGTQELSDLGQEDALQEVITRFILRDQITGLNAGLSSTSVALALLQG